MQTIYVSTKGRMTRTMACRGKHLFSRGTIVFALHRRPEMFLKEGADTLTRLGREVQVTPRYTGASGS